MDTATAIATLTAPLPCPATPDDWCITVGSEFEDTSADEAPRTLSQIVERYLGGLDDTAEIIECYDPCELRIESCELGELESFYIKYFPTRG